MIEEITMEKGLSAAQKVKQRRETPLSEKATHFVAMQYRIHRNARNNRRMNDDTAGMEEAQKLMNEAAAILRERGEPLPLDTIKINNSSQEIANKLMGTVAKPVRPVKSSQKFKEEW